MSRRSQVTDATLRLAEACHAYCMSRRMFGIRVKTGHSLQHTEKQYLASTNFGRANHCFDS